MAIDRIDWHLESISGEIPEDERWELGGVHIGYFIEWAYKKGFAPNDSETHDADEYKKVVNSEVSGIQFLIENCDTKFWEEDLNEDGQKFASFAYNTYLGNFEAIVGHEPYRHKYNQQDLQSVSKYLDTVYSDYLANPPVMTKEVNYKKNKTAIFHDDSLGIEGRKIPYDNIDGVSFMYNDTVYKLLGIPFGRWVTAVAAISVKDEKKPVSASFQGIRFLGIPIIPTPQKAQDGFTLMFEAIDSIVTTRIAQRYLEQIYAGKEVEIAGLLISQLSAVNKKRDKMISKGNYGGMQHTFNHGIVLDKSGNTIWRTSMKSGKNVTILPHILDELFLVT